MIEYRPVLDTFKPYLADENTEVDLPVKLDANEYPEELPTIVKNKIIERINAAGFNRYPQISGLELCRKIAGQFGLEAKNVFLGNGSSQILAALCFAFSDKERGIVYPCPSFSMYGIYPKLADSQGIPVELEPDFSLDRAKLLKTAIEKKAGVILLCNPNNPTGNVMPHSDIEYIVANAPGLVIIDEAYQEFYGISALSLLAKYSNVAIARTFSKMYSLAALRIGYVLASEKVISTLSKVILPYNINALSLIAAETVLSMKEFFAERKSKIAAERQRMFHLFSEIPNIRAFPSETNFILIKVFKDSALLAKHLTNSGIGVRDFSNAPYLEGCIRITIGAPEENNACLAAIKSFIEKERQL